MQQRLDPLMSALASAALLVLMLGLARSASGTIVRSMQVRSGIYPYAKGYRELTAPFLQAAPPQKATES